MKLSDLKIRNAKPTEKPYKLFDGGGLHILVKPNGSKTWLIKYYFLGKERLFTIGAYPLYKRTQAHTLQQARIKVMNPLG